MDFVWILKDKDGDETAYLEKEKAYKDAFACIGIPEYVANDLVHMLYELEDTIDGWLEAYGCTVYTVELFR